MLKNCKICNKTFKTKQSRIDKGNGKYCSPECYFKDKKGKENPKIKGNLHGGWKENAGYMALHKYVRNRKVKPKECEFCHKVKRLELAKDSEEYTRNLKDYVYICRSCHSIKDNFINNIKKVKNNEQERTRLWSGEGVL